MNIKIIITVLLFIFTQFPVFAGEFGISQNITNEKYYEYLNAIINDKSIIFNALNLSPEQRKKYEQITNKYSPLYKNNLRKILEENPKPNTNKNSLNIYEKEIIKLSHDEEEELKTILNKAQRAKYRQIKHLENHDLKKELHPQNYYKLNPQMTNFKNP